MVLGLLRLFLEAFENKVSRRFVFLRLPARAVRSTVNVYLSIVQPDQLMLYGVHFMKTLNGQPVARLRYQPTSKQKLTHALPALFALATLVLAACARNSSGNDTSVEVVDNGKAATQLLEQVAKDYKKDDAKNMKLSAEILGADGARGFTKNNRDDSNVTVLLHVLFKNGERDSRSLLAAGKIDRTKRSAQPLQQPSNSSRDTAILVGAVCVSNTCDEVNYYVTRSIDAPTGVEPQKTSASPTPSPSATPTTPDASRIAVVLLHFGKAEAMSADELASFNLNPAQTTELDLQRLFLLDSTPRVAGEESGTINSVQQSIEAMKAAQKAAASAPAQSASGGANQPAPSSSLTPPAPVTPPAAAPAAPPAAPVTPPSADAQPAAPPAAAPVTPPAADAPPVTPPSADAPPVAPAPQPAPASAAEQELAQADASKIKVARDVLTEATEHAKALRTKNKKQAATDLDKLVEKLKADTDRFESARATATKGENDQNREKVDADLEEIKKFIAANQAT